MSVKRIHPQRRTPRTLQISTPWICQPRRRQPLIHLLSLCSCCYAPLFTFLSLHSCLYTPVFTLLSLHSCLYAFLRLHRPTASNNSCRNMGLWVNLWQYIILYD